MFNTGRISSSPTSTRHMAHAPRTLFLFANFFYFPDHSIGTALYTCCVCGLGERSVAAVSMGLQVAKAGPLGRLSDGSDGASWCTWAGDSGHFRLSPKGRGESG